MLQGRGVPCLLGLLVLDFNAFATQIKCPTYLCAELPLTVSQRVRADYTIRMNFTTVPRTWEKVRKWTHRIPVHYKARASLPACVQQRSHKHVAGLSATMPDVLRRTGSSYVMQGLSCIERRAPCSAAGWREAAGLSAAACGSQEYYTSGFLSLQGAVDMYALGLRLPAALDTSLIAPPGANGSARVGAPTEGFGRDPAGLAGLAAWTQWGVVMPTSAYTHNDFYVRGPVCAQSASFAGTCNCNRVGLPIHRVVCILLGAYYHVRLLVCQCGDQSSLSSNPCQSCCNLCRACAHVTVPLHLLFRPGMSERAAAACRMPSGTACLGCFCAWRWCTRPRASCAAWSRRRRRACARPCALPQPRPLPSAPCFTIFGRARAWKARASNARLQTCLHMCVQRAE